MPNGGSDCCGTCWFNRSLGGKRGSSNYDRSIPSHCQIRELDIPEPFSTYCANHPYHRPDGDRIPIGPVYVLDDAMKNTRAQWEPSPDTEKIRQHLLDLVRLPESHRDTGYHFYTHPAHVAAIWQLLEWRDERLVAALEEIAQHPKMKRARASIEETIGLVRERLGM